MDGLSVGFRYWAEFATFAPVKPTRIAVIGAGAAGYFAAIHAKENFPEAEVLLLEKTSKVLSKLRISGGGRCNVTNGTRSIAELTKAYPRGGRQLKKLFGTWNTQHTWEWFETRGVKLKEEDDGRVFPTTDDSETVADCLERAAIDAGVQLRLSCRVHEIGRTGINLTLTLEQGQEKFSHVIVATGGSPTRRGLEWLEDLGHAIADPVPSLFTFNLPSDPIRHLMGLSAPALARIPGTKLQESGQVLVTHWGISGPGVLKLSSWGARELANREYRFEVSLNWAGKTNQEHVLDDLLELQESHPRKKLSNARPYRLPERLWLLLLDEAGLSPERVWGELGSKTIYKLVQVLVDDLHDVQGKTTFKEEFVTCGGIAWESVAAKTLQSKHVRGLYFAGEVLDVDAITGGYNFQAAWTTAYHAAQLKD